MTRPTASEKELIRKVQKSIAYTDLSLSQKGQRFIPVYSIPGELSDGKEFLGNIRRKFAPFKRVFKKHQKESLENQKKVPIQEKRLEDDLIIGEIYQITIWSPYGSKALLQGELDSFSVNRDMPVGKRIEKIVLKQGLHINERDLGYYFENKVFHPLGDGDVLRVYDKGKFCRMRDAAKCGAYFI